MKKNKKTGSKFIPKEPVPEPRSKGFHHTEGVKPPRKNIGVKQ